MNRRLLLLLPPLALAVPNPAAALPPEPGVPYGRLCGGAGGGGEPRREDCPVACHAMPCERHRPGGKHPRPR